MTSRGTLPDLEGVLYQASKAIDGAAKANDSMGLAVDEILMVGGLRSLRARTGKFTPMDLDHPRIAADGVLASNAALPRRIHGLRQI